MDKSIPRNTPENEVSGGSGRIMMVKLSRKAMKTGFWGELGCGGTRLKTKVTQVDSNFLIDRSECPGQVDTLGIWSGNLS